MFMGQGDEKTMVAPTWNLEEAKDLKRDGSHECAPCARRETKKAKDNSVRCAVGWESTARAGSRHVVCPMLNHQVKTISTDTSKNPIIKLAFCATSPKTKIHSNPRGVAALQLPKQSGCVVFRALSDEIFAPPLSKLPFLARR